MKRICGGLAETQRRKWMNMLPMSNEAYVSILVIVLKNLVSEYLYIELTSSHVNELKGSKNGTHIITDPLNVLYVQKLCPFDVVSINKLCIMHFDK